MKYILDNECDCVGCMACYSSCPVNAIKIYKNDEGFLYPKIDEKKCINCKKCYNVCPVINKKNTRSFKEIHAYRSKDLYIWKNSTSGGAFSDICNAIYKYHKKLIIYGAEMNGFSNKHTRIEIKDLGKIRGSKYIQSNINDTYIKIKEDLKNECYVIFSGTPCQVSGLKRFLDREYEKLICIDFICHGVGNEEVLKKCISQIENEKRIKIKQYSFRYKVKLFGAQKRYFVKYILDSGKKVVEKNDYYMNLFLNGVCLRNSCLNNCKFKTENSESDITLADLNSKSTIFPDLYDPKNFSTIIFNNRKNIWIKDELLNSGILLNLTEEMVRKFNPLYYKNASENNLRTAFFDDFFKKNLSKNEILKRYCHRSIYKKSIQDFLPYSFKFFINKLLHKRRRD